MDDLGEAGRDCHSASDHDFPLALGAAAGLAAEGRWEQPRQDEQRQADSIALGQSGAVHLELSPFVLVRASGAKAGPAVAQKVLQGLRAVWQRAVLREELLALEQQEQPPVQEQPQTQPE